MKNRLCSAILIGALTAATLSHAATIVEWDFETSSLGIPVTNGLPFDADGSGDSGAIDTNTSAIVYGWDDYFGPSFSSDNLYYNGFCMRNADNHQDGYHYGGPIIDWGPTNWTIECTVRLDEIAGWETIIGKDGATDFGSGASSESDFYLANNGIDDSFRLNYVTLGGQRPVIDATNVTVQAGQWYGLAAVCDGTNVSLYIDEQDGNGYELEGQVALTNTVANNALAPSSFNWTFGRGWFGGSFVDHINGAIDNIRFSDTALTPAELIPVPADPFKITGSPAETTSETSQSISATVIDWDSEFSSATLYLDGASVAVNNTPSGTTNSVIYAATGLYVGTHTGEVVVVGVNPAATDTYTWTFEVSQPPFDAITVISPADGSASTNDSQTLEVEIIENFSIAGAGTALYLDGADTGAVVDRSLAPTSTISYAASGLSHGVHTGMVVVVGDPSGVYTNEWTFKIVGEPVKPTTLLHHWDFEDGSGTTVMDIVGAKHGLIINTNYAWIGGSLDLSGDGTSGDYDNNLGTTNLVGSYVDLPNGLVTDLPNAVTFEITYEMDTDAWWMRVWDMGIDESNLENVIGTGGRNIFLTTHANNADGGLRCAVATNAPGYDHEYSQMDDTVNASNRVGEVTHVVWIYDTDYRMTKLYVNGELQDFDAMVPGTEWHLSQFANYDLNNWIGRAQYPDNMFDGKLFDFRIYSGVMTAAEALARYDEVKASGTPTVEPVIQSISVASGTVTLSWTAEETGKYSVESSITDLTAPDWTPVLTNLPAGNQTTNFPAIGGNLEFYRVTGDTL